MVPYQRAFISFLEVSKEVFLAQSTIGYRITGSRIHESHNIPNELYKPKKEVMQDDAIELIEWNTYNQQGKASRTKNRKIIDTTETRITTKTSLLS